MRCTRQAVCYRLHGQYRLGLETRREAESARSNYSRLLLAESKSLLDTAKLARCLTDTSDSRNCQLLFEDIVRLVSRQVDTVETSVTLGELSELASLFDCEAAWTIGALEILEAVDGDTRCSGGELKQTRLALRGPATNALPEPLDDLIRWVATLSVGPVIRKTY